MGGAQSWALKETKNKNKKKIAQIFELKIRYLLSSGL